METIEEFESKYTMNIDSYKSKYMCPETQQGMYETFGSDLEYVKSVDHDRIWTAIDCSSGLVLVHGFQLVDRVYYIITEEMGNPTEEYLISE